MLYVWAAIAIAILFLVWQIVRWWNLPATIENRRKAQESRSRAWADWRATRVRIFGRRRDVTPRVEPKSPDNFVEVKPVKPKEEEIMPQPVAREGFFARWRRKRLER